MSDQLNDEKMSDISHGDFLELRKDVQDIKSALMGSSQYGQEGLVDRVQALEQEINDLRVFKTKMIGYTSGAAGAATVIMNLIMNFI